MAQSSKSKCSGMLLMLLSHLGWQGASAEEESALGFFLERFVRHAFLPQYESRCIARLTAAITSQDAWKRDIQHSAPDGNRAAGMTTVLASACEVDSMIQEVVGLCTALPDCESELMSLATQLLTTYLQTASGVLNSLLSNSPVESLMGRPELMSVLRSDPLYHVIKEKHLGLSSPSKALTGSSSNKGLRRSKSRNVMDVDLSMCDDDVVEAHFILEHLRTDQVLMGGGNQLGGTGGVSAVFSQAHLTAMGEQMVKDVQKIQANVQKEVHQLGSNVQNLVKGDIRQLSLGHAQRKGEGAEAMSDVGKLHMSLMWLAERSHMRGIEMMDKGKVLLDALTSAAVSFTRVRKGGRVEEEDGIEEGGSARVAEVLRAAGSLSAGGVAQTSQEFGVRYSQGMFEVEESLKDAGDKLLLGMRQQLRYFVLSQTVSMLHSILMPSHFAGFGGGGDRQGDGLRKVLVGVDTAVQKYDTLPPSHPPILPLSHPPSLHERQIPTNNDPTTLAGPCHPIFEPTSWLTSRASSSSYSSRPSKPYSRTTGQKCPPCWMLW